MIDNHTKVRMALGLQQVPCETCIHGIKDYHDQPSRVVNQSGRIFMYCTLYEKYRRGPGDCIPNTYRFFKAR